MKKIGFVTVCIFVLSTLTLTRDCSATLRARYCILRYSVVIGHRSLRDVARYPTHGMRLLQAKVILGQRSSFPKWGRRFQAMIEHVEACCSSPSAIC